MGDSLHLRSERDGPRAEGEDDPAQGRRARSPRWRSTATSASSRSPSAIPKGFAVGAGVTIWDDHSGGFHTTVARITGRDGNRFSIDADLMSDYMVSAHAKAATVFPVIGGTDIRSARVEDLVIEGNKEANPYLNGCRGGGDLPLPRLRRRDPGLRGAELSRRRDQLPAIQRRDGGRLRRRGQHAPRAASGQRLAAADGPRLPGPPQRDRRAVPLLARPPRDLRGQPPGGERPGRHLDRAQGLGQPAARQPGRPQRHLRRALPRRGGRDVAAPESPGAERHRGQRPVARGPRASASAASPTAWSSKATRSATPARESKGRRRSAS